MNCYYHTNIYKIKFILLASLLYGCSFFPSNDENSPYSFILTWQNDPTTTMTIDWHTDADDNFELKYRKKGDNNWGTKQNLSHNFPYSDRIIHRLELTGLEPETKYEFKFNESKVYKFQTLPTTISRPIKFAAGGDMMRNKEWMVNTNRQAASYELDFVLIGGDLAYADALPEKANRWYDFLDAWSETMITDNGRVIPILVSIGNHEVKKGFASNYENYEQTDRFRLAEAPYFYNIFAFPGQPGYNVLDFGDYLSVVILDSNHTNPISGKQTDWLKEILINRKHMKHIIPVYHVPAYPSVRNYTNVMNREIRENWVSLFDQVPNLRVSFENHDHAYKRTYPLKENEINELGIYFIGDGAWGVEPRKVNENYWYIEESKSVQHFTLVKLMDDRIYLNVIDQNGVEIDNIEIFIN